MDIALIIGGVVAQVWRNTPVEDLPAPEIGELVAMATGEAVCGMLWDGEELSLPKPSLQEAKAAKKTEIMAHRDTVFNDGGYTVPTGTMAGHVLQTRTFGEDRTNWLTSQGAYKAMIDGGHGALVGAKFRTKANVNFDVTYDEGYAVILGMAAWGSLVVARAWALCDEAEAAADHAALDAIDITAGWP